MPQSRDGIAHHRPGPGALIFPRVPQFTPPTTDSQQPHVSAKILYPTRQLTWTFQTGALIATQTALQGFPHYPYLLDSSFLQSHWLLNLPGCHFPSSRSPAVTRSLLFYSTLLLTLSAVPAEVLHAMASASLSRKGKTLLC